MLALARAAAMDHVMEFGAGRAMAALGGMLDQGVRNVLAHSDPDPLDSDSLRAYMDKYLLYAVLWSFAGDARAAQYVVRGPSNHITCYGMVGHG
jgi:dynein heavy chain 1